MKIITTIFSPLARGGAFATFLAMAFLCTSLSAKEPTNWIFGFGIGAGLSQLEQKWGESSRNGLNASTNNGNNNITWNTFRVMTDTNFKDWGVAWEFLAGYKHWLNDWVGFRYYANIGAQHYKVEFPSGTNDSFISSGNTKMGALEYTANADILLNFYNSELFTFGILGGFGIGGAYFDSPALDNYEKYWGAAKDSTSFTEPEYAGVGKIKKHHLSASLSVGTRFNFFQKIRNVSARTCDTGADGRRTCKVPISYLEHSIELNAKFNMLTYYPTKYGELMGVRKDNGNGAYTDSRSRPGYEVKNPYKFTLRYIIAF